MKKSKNYCSCCSYDDDDDDNDTTTTPKIRTPSSISISADNNNNNAAAVVSSSSATAAAISSRCSTIMEVDDKDEDSYDDDEEEEEGHHYHQHHNNNHRHNDNDINIACFLFAIIGIGYLFPFSALTQPVDYWQLLFPDYNIEFPITTVYMYTNLLTLGGLVFLGTGGTTTTEDDGSHRQSLLSSFITERIVGGFVGQLLILVFVPTVLYFCNYNERTNAITVIGSTAVAAIVTAFIDSTIIALAAQYPLRVQEFFQLGIGISTLIGSIYRDITKFVFPPDMIPESSLLYFYSGAATIGLCILAYYQLMKLPLSKQCLQQQQSVVAAVAAAPAKADEEKKENGDEEANSATAGVDHHHYHHHVYHNMPATAAISEASALLSPTTRKTTTSTTATDSDFDDNNNNNKFVILRKILYNELMVCMLFASTLALWPPLVTEIKSFNFPSLQDSGWWPLMLLTLFSCMDCLGRVLVRYRFFLNRHNIWVAVLGRFVLFPLIVCSVQGRIFTHDAFSVVFVGCLGLTNGYVGTLCIVLVNECVSEKEQATAGSFTSFFLNSGLVLGATIGLILDNLIER